MLLKSLLYCTLELTYRGCFMDPDSGISPPKGRWDDWLTYNEYHNVSTLNNKFDWISVEKCAERCFLSSYPYMSLSVGTRGHICIECFNNK